MSASRRLFSVPRPTRPTEHDDHECLQALAHEARTSESAFDRLARAVRGMVLRWAHSATRDVDEAEDVAQLVLLRLRAKGDGFDGRGSLAGWLHRVTRNITLDRQRIARRRQLLLQAALRDAEDAATPSHPEHPPLVPIVRAFLTELTPRQQTVIELIDLRGLETTAVATQLGISPSTVRVLLAQGRRRLRVRLLSAHPELLEDYRP